MDICIHILYWTTHAVVSERLIWWELKMLLKICGLKFVTLQFRLENAYVGSSQGGWGQEDWVTQAWQREWRHVREVRDNMENLAEEKIAESWLRIQETHLLKSGKGLWWTNRKWAVGVYLICRKPGFMCFAWIHISVFWRAVNRWLRPIIKCLVTKEQIVNSYWNLVVLHYSPLFFEI